MKVLLTGAFGFLGGRLAEWLRASGHDIVVSGRRTPPDAAAWARTFEVRNADLVQAPSLDELTRGIEAIVHLASLNENDAIKHPEAAAGVSVGATTRLYEAAKKSGVRTFLFASTSRVYGAGDGVLVDEGTPTSPKHPYAQAHLDGESRCLEGHSESCRAIVLRFSNVYGAPIRLGVNRWTLAHNDFCAKAARGANIVLQSSGLQHRDFLWVEDVASTIDRALRHGGRAEEPLVLNVGGENSRSIYELATIVRDRARELLGTSVRIERPDPRADERQVPVRYSVARLRSLLGYEAHDRLADEADRLIRAIASADAVSASAL